MPTIQDVTRRDRSVVLVALAALIGLAWAYTVRVAQVPGTATGSTVMPDVVATGHAMPWTAADFGYVLAMWVVMMVAMMLPSATPAILVFGRVQARRATAGRPFSPTAAFVMGYVLVWSGFSVAATAASWTLHAGGTLSSMMGRVGAEAGGVLLIAAGVFQFSRLKRACLEHCRSPIAFLTQHWREGVAGATALGLHHGAYCLGCCWLLMTLLFVLGVMNLPWVAVLTIVVLAEKILPRGEIVSRVLGAGLIGWGGWLVGGGFVS